MAFSLTSEWSVTARWVLPMEGPEIPDGIVRIRGEKIVAVEPKCAGTADFDFGNAAILPGFVNAHTHLDLSGLAGVCPPTPEFTTWLRAVIAHRRSQTPEQISADIQSGLEQCMRHGTTLVGDITAGGQSWDQLAAAPIRAVVFHEMIGLTSDRAEQAWKQASQWLADHPATPTCRPGLSPHAPYSVRASLFEATAKLPPDVPVAIHVAETQAEEELLQHRSGPFVEFLNELGVWDASGLLRSHDELLHLFAKRQALFVHGNYLKPEHDKLSGHHVIYCPRTHSAFQHAEYHYKKMHLNGADIGIGTDSLASNPGLDMLGELRWLRQKHPETSCYFWISCATYQNARALNWHHETGSLVPGKSADLVVVPLADDVDIDPYQMVLESPLDVAKVMCRGKWI